VTWSVHPEPSDETERRALLAALSQALAEEQDGAQANASPWWRAGLEDLDLGGLSWGPAAEQSWREPGVVEP
jgi:hypothetical protein